MKTPVNTSGSDEWTGDEALRVVTFLQLIINEIWRFHGNKMAECLRLEEQRHRVDMDDDFELPF